jgi:chorismate mutase / prephenate dehydratase
MDQKLIEIREQLDSIDSEIIGQLAARQQLISEVAQTKGDSQRLLRDSGRELDVLKRLVSEAEKRGLNSWYINKLYRIILDYSVKQQEDYLVDRDNPDQQSKELVIAYQGTNGSYSQMAAMQQFSTRGANVEYRGHNSFAQVLDVVSSGAAHYGVLPIENTTAGSINDTYDLLAKTRLSIIGEVVQKIDHCLLGPQNVPLSHIRRIYSQAPALAQCTNFLSTLSQCEVQSFTDTAMAVRKVGEDQDLSQAAIGSEEAGQLYGLHVLKRNIADQRENYTRFVVVAPTPVDVDTRIPCKTSLVLATRHEHGALLNCLNVFAKFSLNLCKLESRPRLNSPWEYLFYIDFEGNLVDDNISQALRELKNHTRFLKILGSYPSRTTGGAPVSAAPAQRELTNPKPGSDPKTPTLIELLDKKPYKIASRATREQDTIIHVGSVKIGGPDPVVIAGPCSVESEGQVCTTADWVKAQGAHILRGGCFKPRTSPYSFQGLGFDGLDLLSQAGGQNSMPIITEVMRPSDVEKVAEQADILQIGARNMQNFSLLKEVGRVQRPVMLKRGMMASIDEWLNAAEYILSQGNHEVILCERGIRTFETATRNTLDLSAIVVIKERTHLPIIVDPSHAVGVRRWVIPMVKAALAAGAHGVMVEVHPKPEEALSDGPQALTFDMFVEVMAVVESFKQR